MANWSVMRKELPGLTDEDIGWLSSMTQAMGQQTRLEGGSPRRSSTKSKGGSASQEGPTVHRDKRPGSKRPGTWPTAKKGRARSRGASPRRSARHCTEPAPTTSNLNEQHSSGPSGLARQASAHRRGLPRALREPHGSPRGRGAPRHGTWPRRSRAICAIRYVLSPGGSPMLSTPLGSQPVPSWSPGLGPPVQ
jgi:hypothetical protein